MRGVSFRVNDVLAGRVSGDRRWPLESTANVSARRSGPEQRVTLKCEDQGAHPRNVDGFRIFPDDVVRRDSVAISKRDETRRVRRQGFTDRRPGERGSCDVLVAGADDRALGACRNWNVARGGDDDGTDADLAWNACNR